MPQCKNAYSTVVLVLVRQVRIKTNTQTRKPNPISMHIILLWKDLGTHPLLLSSPILNDFSTVLYRRMLIAVVAIVYLLDMVLWMPKRLKDFL